MISRILRGLRQRFFSALTLALPKPHWRKPEGAAKDVTVVGYLRTASGVGEAGRQSLQSLRAGGMTVEGCDVALNVTASRNDDSCDRLLVATSSAPIQIFNINADQLPLVLAHLRPRLRPDAKRICIPFWELSRFPEAWMAGLQGMDEIWAPSRFIAAALHSRLGSKTVHIPVALAFAPPAAAPRETFHLPPGRFLFFFAFDFLSFVARKNPFGLISAFRQAFPQRGQAGLVLKCTNGQAAPAKKAELMAAIAGDPDIFLIDATLSRIDTLALIASMDAVVSLHRSEGLGLLIGEAMLLGKPVIATDYSATQDFLSATTGYPVQFKLIPVAQGEYPFAEDQVWADPDIDHAAALMQGLQRDPAQAHAKIANAKAHMQANFSTRNVGCLQAERIRMLRQAYNDPPDKISVWPHRRV